MKIKSNDRIAQILRSMIKQDKRGRSVSVAKRKSTTIYDVN